MEEEEWNKKYDFLFLDDELYGNRKDMTKYLILTKKELEQLKKKTRERMKKLEGVWLEEDYDKLNTPLEGINGE